MKKFKGVMSVSRLIGAVIVAVVLGALIGTVADGTIGSNNASQEASNVTGATYTLTALVPLFLIIAVIISYVSDV